MVDIDLRTAKQAPPLDRFHEIEIEHLLQAIAHAQGFRVQSGIFFGTIYLGALGIAFTTRNAGLVMLASALLWGHILVDLRLRRTLHSFLYRALQLQEIYAPNESNTYLALVFTHRQTEFRRIQSISDRTAQQQEFANFLMHSPSGTGFWLPLLASFAGIGLGMLLWLAANWSLF